MLLLKIEIRPQFSFLDLALSERGLYFGIVELQIFDFRGHVALTREHVFVHLCDDLLSLSFADAAAGQIDGRLRAFELFALSLPALAVPVIAEGVNRLIRDPILKVSRLILSLDPRILKLLHPLFPLQLRFLAFSPVFAHAPFLNPGVELLYFVPIVAIGENSSFAQRLIDMQLLNNAIIKNRGQVLEELVAVAKQPSIICTHQLVAAKRLLLGYILINASQLLELLGRQHANSPH